MLRQPKQYPGNIYGIKLPCENMTFTQFLTNKNVLTNEISKLQYEKTSSADDFGNSPVVLRKFVVKVQRQNSN